MYPFAKKSSRASGLSAFGFAPDGVACARVVRDPGVPAVLQSCAFRPVHESGEWGQAVSELCREDGLDIAPCTIVMAHDGYSLLLVEAPDVPPTELRAAVSWRIGEMIDFPVDDAVIDVFDVPLQRDMGRPAMLYVVAAPVSRVSEMVKIAESARLDLDCVDIPELAQRNLAAELPQDVGGVALLYLAERTGLITLTRQQTLYLARRLDVGVGDLSCDGPVADAEDPATRHWIDGLVVEVQRSLDYYERNFAQPPIGSLIVAPLPVTVSGMAEYMAQQLGLQVRRLDLNDVIDSAQQLDDLLQARCFPVIGAALRHEAAST